MLRLRLLRVVFHRENRQDGVGSGNLGATIQPLAIRRASASCRATHRLLNGFLDVSFQHSNWSVCNLDANSPWIRLSL